MRDSCFTAEPTAYVVPFATGWEARANSSRLINRRSDFCHQHLILAVDSLDLAPGVGLGLTPERLLGAEIHPAEGSTKRSPTEPTLAQVSHVSTPASSDAGHVVFSSI